MNEMKMQGIDFIEFAGGQTGSLEKLFLEFGFSKLTHNPVQNVDYFGQNDIHFFINYSKNSKAGTFAKLHGPSICGMGWRFQDPEAAYRLAISRGACPAIGDYRTAEGVDIPCVYGIGHSLIYFVTSQLNKDRYSSLGFKAHPQARPNVSKGFLSIDHLTNNVENGTMKIWSDFYKKIFGFSEVRYFDIRGVQTGLKSYALKSPCGTFCIPINEAKETKSQINEYLAEYHGPGVQHLAFLTDSILESLDRLNGTGIQTLDIDDEYYESIFHKFPQVTEDHRKIRDHQVLVDGDENGYLLQIFTKNLIGPIFIEIIQRKNHYSFGEGNFSALFRSIERDQIKRGYLPS